MSAIGNTLSIWKALFLREALSRFFLERGAWLWLIVEPIVHVAYLLVIYTVVRAKTVGGVDTAMWLLLGLQGFFLFRRTATQTMNAVEANAALFTYRQVKPVDTVLVRSFLEALLLIVVTLILFAGASLLGHDVTPDRPLAVASACFGLWMMGLGFGLVASVLSELVPEIGRIQKIVMMPLYLISGVIFPLSAVPQPYREWLLYNPVAHGLEAARIGFSANYHAVPELSVGYLHACALTCVFFGLALHRRFASRLVMQ